MSDSTDLPEGVIDANPPGGWVSGDAADGETAQQNADAAGSPLLSESASDALHGEGDELDRPDAAVPPAAPVESDEPGQIADPDLSSDDETDDDAETYTETDPHGGAR